MATKKYRVKNWTLRNISLDYLYSSIIGYSRSYVFPTVSKPGYTNHYLVA